MKLFISISAGRTQSWFDSLKPAEKKAYLKEHPNSKFGKPVKQPRKTVRVSSVNDLMSDLRAATTKKEVGRISKDLNRARLAEQKADYDKAKQAAKKAYAPGDIGALRSQLKEVKAEARKLWRIVAPLAKQKAKYIPDAAKAAKVKADYTKAYDKWNAVNTKVVQLTNKIKLLSK